MPRFTLAASLLLCTVSAVAQNSPTSDPLAVSLAQQSMTALNGGAAISDVTLTGNANWIAGSDQETGHLTLRAKGVAGSRIDLNLSGGTRTEIRNDTAGFPQGESIRPDGTVHAWATHNCWIDASWFFPALSFLSAASDPTLVFSYVGLETHRQATVQHLRIFRYLAGQKPAYISLTQRISTMDIYLDATSLLPRAFVFTNHPDDDALTDVAVEILFSNYQAVNGVQTPLRIQRLIQNGLAVDLVVTGVALNSGLPDSLFAVQ